MLDTQPVANAALTLVEADSTPNPGQKAPAGGCDWALHYAVQSSPSQRGRCHAIDSWVA